LVGWLGILDPVKSRFLLKTEKGVAYELMGEIKGLEKLEGKKLEVTGTYVYTLVATEYPLFYVISYKIIDETTPTTAPTAVVITEKDDGGYVYVKKGDVVKLSLESNKTTGYSWNIDEPFDKTVLLQTGYEYIIDQKDGKMVGAGGREVWTFNAVGEGTTVTYLSYSKPWESIPPAKSFKVKVIVEGLSTPTPSYDVLKGVLVVMNPTPGINESLINPYQFILRTEKGPFTLMGNIKGLEAYNGAEIEVTGKVADMTITPPYFDVISYVILTKPTPTPSYTVLKGTLNVKKTDIISIDDSVLSYQLTLITESGPFTLLGNTKGLETCNGAVIEVKGTISPLAIYPPYFNVISYAILTTPTATPPTPTPSYDVLKGTLIVNKFEPALKQVAPQYEFLLKTENGPYRLTGNVKGLEKYDGSVIEVPENSGLLKNIHQTLMYSPML
jgi:inhibitor of cysteine peptidase